MSFNLKQHFVQTGTNRFAVNVDSFQTCPPQFCKTLRKLVLSRRVAKATAVLGACLLLYLGAVSTCSILLAALLPFLIWMAS